MVSSRKPQKNRLPWSTGQILCYPSRVMIDLIISRIPNIIGLTGVCLCLGSYFLVQTGRLKANTLSYTLANFIASWLILVSLCYHWNLSSAIIEVVWGVISLYGVFRALQRRKENNHNTQPKAVQKTSNA